MTIQFKPIGFVKTSAETVPKHWSVSELVGDLVVDQKFQKGIADIKEGQRIIVIFHFHKCPEFSDNLLRQTPHGGKTKKGVFSICSPRRPNSIGMSVLEVISVNENIIRVRGVDMLDGTPILDIKPYI